MSAPHQNNRRRARARLARRFIWPASKIVSTITSLCSLLALLPALAEGQAVVSGTKASIRVLDRFAGRSWVSELAVGEAMQVGPLLVSLRACRYPSENPRADAFAFLEITDVRREAQAFRGWMIASSPALNALDHPRYDVWVLACN